jgi:hypothetical protein
VGDTELRDPLAILVAKVGKALPEGCDRWGMRAVRADLRSSRGFRWPFPGQWADAPGPIREHRGSCPIAVGDGICVATTVAGMASGGITARTMLLCAFSSDDIVGDSEPGKLRVRRAFVVELVDGEAFARTDLRDANLRGANLYGANLRGADLRDADLRGANLRGANLRGANLYDADLYGADLYGADLRGANLYGANLRGANLYGANLRDASASAFTSWPEGFDKTACGVVTL